MKDKACPASQWQPLAKRSEYMESNQWLPNRQAFDQIMRYCELPWPHTGQPHEFCTPQGVMTW